MFSSQTINAQKVKAFPAIMEPQTQERDGSRAVLDSSRDEAAVAIA
jgi:predicted HAD superfamily Cof-like phosphohydrolase